MPLERTSVGKISEGSMLRQYVFSFVQLDSCLQLKLMIKNVEA